MVPGGGAAVVLTAPARIARDDASHVGQVSRPGLPWRRRPISSEQPELNQQDGGGDVDDPTDQTEQDGARET